MTFQYIKSSNSLKQKGRMNNPGYGSDTHIAAYLNHLDSLKEYPVIGTGWEEGKEYVEGKDFEVEEYEEGYNEGAATFARTITYARLTPSKEEGEESQEELLDKLRDLYEKYPPNEKTAMALHETIKTIIFNHP